MRVLLVEDETVLRSQLKQMLEQAGYAVDGAGDGQAALHLGATEPYDAVVLDLGLPVLDGLTVLQRWRGQGLSMPVLILTARDSWHEKVAGIDAGADDYLAKPFHTEELLARLRALVRRTHGLTSPLLQQGDVTLDTRTGTVALKGITVTLTAHGYRLLGISGFSQYDKLFADVELRLREGWLDYLAPQLYWPRANRPGVRCAVAGLARAEPAGPARPVRPVHQPHRRQRAKLNARRNPGPDRRRAAPQPRQWAHPLQPGLSLIHI